MGFLGSFLGVGLIVVKGVLFVCLFCKIVSTLSLDRQDVLWWIEMIIIPMTRHHRIVLLLCRTRILCCQEEGAKADESLMEVQPVCLGIWREPWEIE